MIALFAAAALVAGPTPDTERPLSAVALTVGALEELQETLGDAPWAIHALESRYAPGEADRPDAVEVTARLELFAPDAETLADRLLRVAAVGSAERSSLAPPRAAYERLKSTWIDPDWVHDVSATKVDDPNSARALIDLCVTLTRDEVAPEEPRPRKDSLPDGGDRLGAERGEGPDALQTYLVRHAVSERVSIGYITLTTRNREFGGVEHKVVQVRPAEREGAVDRVQIAHYLHSLQAGSPVLTVTGVSLKREASAVDRWTFDIEVAVPTE